MCIHAKMYSTVREVCGHMLTQYDCPPIVTDHSYYMLCGQCLYFTLKGRMNPLFNFEVNNRSMMVSLLASLLPTPELL